MIRFLVSLLVFAAGSVAALITSGVQTGIIFLDFPSFIIAVVVPFLFVSVLFGFKEMGEAFSTPLQKEAEKDKLARSLAFFKTYAKATWLAGLISVLLGVITMLCTLEDKASVGPMVGSCLRIASLLRNNKSGNNSSIYHIYKKAFERVTVCPYGRIQTGTKPKGAIMANPQKKVSQKNAMSAQSFFENGKAAYDKKDYDKAIADCTEALRLDPDYKDAYINRANAYFCKDDCDKAIADYTEVIRIDPNNTSAYINRGAFYNFKGDNDRGITDLTHAIRIDPNDTSAYINRAFTYDSKGDCDRSIAYLTHAIQIAPNDTTAYSNRAFTYNCKGDYDRAIADADKAIQLDPDFVYSYRHRGFAYMQKGNFTQARADVNKALQLEPNYELAKKLDAELKEKGY